MAFTKRQIRASCFLCIATMMVLIQTTVGRPSSSFPLGIRLAHKTRLVSGSSTKHSARTAFSTRDERDMWREVEHAYRYPNQSSQCLQQDDELSALEGTATCAATTAIQSVAPLTVAAEGNPTANTRGGGGAGAAIAAAADALSHRPLVFWENMVCGAISRSIAQTVMHPANTMKTILQSARGIDSPTIASLASPKNFRRLTRGAGANFLLSVPHGAVNFAVLEFVRNKMNKIVENNPTLSRNTDRIGPGLDFLSSAISTICCSIVSTPQMMITDNIMAGNYPNLPRAVAGLARDQGIQGFYAGWWPGLAGKIPSYALTWTFFQQLKAAHLRICKRDPRDIENSIMGCIASATTVCLMIPMDTIKTRLVTQASMVSPGMVPYKGIADCAARILREEGIGVFYRGLPPRLVSVVPMIGIQFGVYEFMRKVMLQRRIDQQEEKDQKNNNAKWLVEEKYDKAQLFEEAVMEVAADQDQPFPAPRFRMKPLFENGKKSKSKRKATSK